MTSSALAGRGGFSSFSFRAAFGPAASGPGGTHYPCAHHSFHTQSQKVVVITGPTGSGKSRLSIDLATRFIPSEIINADKMQVYRGLDITTNKIPTCQRLGVPHHLLGEFSPSTGELTASAFRSSAAAAISDIASRRKLPLVVGGSNSFIYALVASRFSPDSDVFRHSQPDPVCTELRYRCCFLWVDVALPVLNRYLSKRVDEMLESGMLDELAQYYDDSQSTAGNALRKAIGVSEFHRYFKALRGRDSICTHAKAFEEGVKAVKSNTRRLAKRQVRKIQRLQDAGWELRRLDATEAYRAALGSDSGGWPGVWERQVVEPSAKIVKRFLQDATPLTFRKAGTIMRCSDGEAISETGAGMIF